MSDVVEDAVLGLSKKVASLDVLVAKLVASLEAHIREERQLEQTLRNIDNSLNKLTLKFAASPMETHREIHSQINPIMSIVREHEKRFAKYSEHIEGRIKNEAKSYVTVVSVLITVLFGLASYVYLTDKNNIKTDIDTNTKHIEQFHVTSGP